jgi:hypothetical protein
MNRSSVFSDNDIESFYDRLTQENSICLGMLKEVNEDSKMKASEITQMIGIINTIQMKLIKWRELKKKIKMRVNV